MLSAAEMNVTLGFDDDPPCVNSEAIADGLALYAARNVDWSNLKTPFWSSVTPARFGLPRLEPATASSIAVASRFASCVVAKSPVSGCAVFVVGSYAVTDAIVWCSALAASTSACTLPARPWRSFAVETVTGPELPVRPTRVSVAPGSRPDTMFDADDTVKAPGPVPIVSCASEAVGYRDETAGGRVEVGARDVEVVERAGRGRGELEAVLVGAHLHRAREHAGAGRVDVADDGAEAAVAGRDVRSGDGARAEAAGEHRGDGARGAFSEIDWPGTTSVMV